MAANEVVTTLTVVPSTIVPTTIVPTHGFAAIMAQENALPNKPMPITGCSKVMEAKTHVCTSYKHVAYMSTQKERGKKA
jgi:hypothetical protein